MTTKRTKKSDDLKAKAQPLTLAQKWSAADLTTELGATAARLQIAYVYNIAVDYANERLIRVIVSPEESEALIVIRCRENDDFKLIDYMLMEMKNINSEIGIKIFSDDRGKIDTSAVIETYFEEEAQAALYQAKRHAETAFELREKRNNALPDLESAATFVGYCAKVAESAANYAEAATKAALGFDYNSKVAQSAREAQSVAVLADYHYKRAAEAQRLDEMERDIRAQEAPSAQPSAQIDGITIDDLDDWFKLTPEEEAQISAAKVAEVAEEEAAKRHQEAQPKIEIVWLNCTVTRLPDDSEAQPITMEQISAHLNYVYDLSNNFAQPSPAQRAPLIDFADCPRIANADFAIKVAFYDAQIAHRAADLLRQLWAIYPASHWQRVDAANQSAIKAAANTYHIAVSAYLGNGNDFAQLMEEAATNRESALGALGEALRIQREHNNTIYSVTERAAQFLANPTTHA